VVRAMDLCLVVPNSTPPRFVNGQVVSLPPVGVLTSFLIYNICLPIFSVCN